MSAMRSASSTTAIWTSARIDVALLDQVLEASGTGDEDVDAAAQRCALRAVAGAAVDGRDAQVARRARAARCTFATCAASSRVGTSTSAVGRFGLALRVLAAMTQTEGERLAGAGGRASRDVAAGQGVGERRGLDRERRFDALIAENTRVRSSGTPSSAKWWYEAKQTPVCRAPTGTTCYFRWDSYGPQLGWAPISRWRLAALPWAGPHRPSADDRRQRA